jgi:hypothetical protein
MNNNSTLKVSELKKMVGERVIQLTNGLQNPLVEMKPIITIG